MLLTQKYSPKKFDELAGHEEGKARVRQWILNWLHGKTQKPLLIYGPPGIGKTSMAYALSEEHDLELIELNASMLRNKQNVERLLGTATLASSLSGRKKLLLIDDADIFEKSDRGGISALAGLLKEVNYPFLLTATDAWAKKLAPVRMLCELLQLKRVSKASIRTLLKKISENEKIHLDEEVLENIAEHSNGDVRAAINDLQAGRLGERDREQDIFNRVRKIFKATSYKEAKEASKGDVDYDLLKLWVDENIPYEYDYADDLANAFNMLSRVDVFEGRIRKSKWVLLRYCFDLLTAGIAMSKKQPYNKFTKYQFPTYLRHMSASMMSRALRKAVCKKIAAKTHVSIHDASMFILLLQALAKENRDEVALFYGFEDEELAFILGTSVHDIRK